MRAELRPLLAPPRCVGRAQLAADLRKLGVKSGRNLLIHCSLRRIGQVEGGAAELLGAIKDVSGPAATLVVPTQTPLNSLSSRTFLAATGSLSATDRAQFIAGMRGFDPAQTPSTGMGALAEYVRTQSVARRSSHPQTSFAALGPGAQACTSVHDLDCHLGERSPLGWLYTSDAEVLLLGVGFSVCTAFHLAEYRLLGVRPRRRYHCFTIEQGCRTECEFTDIDLDDSDFGKLGAAFEEENPVHHGQVGHAECRLLSLRTAVDFACRWLQTHRSPSG